MPLKFQPIRMLDKKIAWRKIYAKILYSIGRSSTWKKKHLKAVARLRSDYLTLLTKKFLLALPHNYLVILLKFYPQLLQWWIETGPGERGKLRKVDPIRVPWTPDSAYRDPGQLEVPLLRHPPQGQLHVEPDSWYGATAAQTARSKQAGLCKVGLSSLWPDWAIFWTLGNFLRPFATINLPESSTFLGNFCKGVKIIHFSCEIIFGQPF